MFTKLTLTNFKSVEHDVIEFTPGLQVFRGNSEAGKTTRVDAINYALFGVSALKTSLEETVRYDQPVSSLKVELGLTIDGVDYTITRGKSGAEIRYGDQSVTGQTETKLFMERLLGVTAQMSAKLLFANQTDIRGVLEDGPTAAAALIETLADLGQIETLVGKIQDQLPCGTTTTLSGQITDCMSDLSQPEPLPPSDASKVAANAVLEAVSLKFNQAKSNLESLKAQAEEGRRELANKARIEAANAATRSRALALQEVKQPETPSVGESALDELRALQADAVGAAKAYKSSKKIFETCDVFTGNREEFFSHQKKKTVDLKSVRDQLSSIRVQAASIRALHVNETTCGFCKKDLSSVPEVIRNNKVAAEKLASILVDEEGALATIQQLEVTLQTLTVMEELDRRNQRLADEYWEASERMPATYSWIGGEIAEPSEDLGPKIAAVEKAWREYRTGAARYQAAQDELITLVEVPVPHSDIWQVAIDAEKIGTALVSEIQAELYEAKVAYATADGEYIRAVQSFEAFKAFRAKDEVRLVELKAKLAETVANNELVKKLRAARPVIANKLWVAVLGTVGHYFSQIRGVRSIISKEETGFKCDGRSVAGLSGSTKDSLGLALRLALVKTFVPNASFIALDEPASGCDANRELAMLGVVAGAGFDQTLLVTHSDLADSFAAKVIQL